MFDKKLNQEHNSNDITLGNTTCRNITRYLRPNTLLTLVPNSDKNQQEQQHIICTKPNTYSPVEKKSYNTIQSNRRTAKKEVKLYK